MKCVRENGDLLLKGRKSARDRFFIGDEYDNSRTVRKMEITSKERYEMLPVRAVMDK